MTNHAYDGGVAQLQEMRDLIIRSEELAGHTPLGWQYALLENWRYADTDHSVEFFQRNAHLWRDEGGGLIGFAISNRGDHRLSLQVTPHHAASLLPIMLDWVRQEWVAGRSGVAINCYRQILSGVKLSSRPDTLDRRQSLAPIATILILAGRRSGCPRAIGLPASPSTETLRESSR